MDRAAAAGPPVQSPAGRAHFRALLATAFPTAGPAAAQSGDPASPHYADLAPHWAQGDYVPMLYSRAAVDRMEMQRIELLPLAD